MPVQSDQQRKYIYYLRNKYKTVSQAPEKDRWVFNSDFDEACSEHIETKRIERYRRLYKK
jgi:hypothetical protein